MSAEQREDLPRRRPTEKWRRMPERIAQHDMVESVAQDPPPGSESPPIDPDTAWMLRYA